MLPYTYWNLGIGCSVIKTTSKVLAVICIPQLTYWVGNIFLEYLHSFIKERTITPDPECKVR